MYQPRLHSAQQSGHYKESEEELLCSGQIVKSEVEEVEKCELSEVISATENREGSANKKWGGSHFPILKGPGRWSGFWGLENGKLGSGWLKYGAVEI